MEEISEFFIFGKERIFVGFFRNNFIVRRW